MVVLRRAMLGAGTHRDPVLSILSGDDHPEVQLICARPITSSLEPGVRILHRPCRPLLRGLEQAHRAALDDHVHRPTRLGQWVLISGSWYYSAFETRPRSGASHDEVHQNEHRDRSARTIGGRDRPSLRRADEWR